jgi:hypothetical protein
MIMTLISKKSRPEKYPVKDQWKTGITYQSSIILGGYKMCFEVEVGCWDTFQEPQDITRDKNLRYV